MERKEHVASDIYFEGFWVSIGNIKITEHLKYTTEEHWARIIAKEYFREKCILPGENLTKYSGHALGKPGSGLQCT